MTDDSEDDILHMLSGRNKNRPGRSIAYRLAALEDEMAAPRPAIQMADVQGLNDAVASRALAVDMAALSASMTAAVASLDTTVATKVTAADITAAIAALVNGAPGALNTLKEIADQLAADESAAAALVSTVGGKASQAALDTLTTIVAGKASATHTHALADVTGLVSALATKAELQRDRVQTDATGLYTWTYPVAFAGGVVPRCQAIAEAPTPQNGVVVNAQVEGMPTNTQCKFRVTRTALTSVALLGLTIAVLQASVVTWIHIQAEAP